MWRANVYVCPISKQGTQEAAYIYKRFDQNLVLDIRRSISTHLRRLLRHPRHPIPPNAESGLYRADYRCESDHTYRRITNPESLTDRGGTEGGPRYLEM